MVETASRWGWSAAAGNERAQARFYLEMIAQSDYARQLAPVVGQNFSDVLDVGAGGGHLTRQCLTAGAKWLAIEPSRIMGEALAKQRSSLLKSGIHLTHLSLPWQDIPEQTDAQTVFAFNLGATHHEAAKLFEALARRAKREMVWAVPAQHGPSTFCLAGILPPELHGSDTRPAFERTLENLSASHQPVRIYFVDWHCRMTFRSPELAIEHFLTRLDVRLTSDKGQAISDFLRFRLKRDGQGHRLACPKRSAVMRWIF